MDHVIRGIAVTARYVPTNKSLRIPENYEDFRTWESNWYNILSGEPFVPFIKKGTVVVLDVQGDGDTGSVGSYNSLDWYSRGAVGIVSNGGIRDTDEIILQRIPTYLDMANRRRGIRPGRNEIESVNQPVSIAGALVRPGDVIVAEGGWVELVSLANRLKPLPNLPVKYWMVINPAEKLYEKLNRPLDKSVKN